MLEAESWGQIQVAGGRAPPPQSVGSLRFCIIWRMASAAKNTKVWKPLPMEDEVSWRFQGLRAI